MSRSAFSKPVDGVGSRKCVVMHGLKFPVSAAVRLVGIVFWIQSRTEDDAVSVGRGPEPHQHGMRLHINVLLTIDQSSAYIIT